MCRCKDPWRVFIGGSPQAIRRWGQGRTYACRASARRRMKQVHEAHDMGVQTCWAVPVGRGRAGFEG